MLSADFSSLPGFSRLFTDVVAGDSFLMSRFPGNTSASAIAPGVVQRRLAHSYNREALVGAVRETMDGLPLHPQQQQSLQALAEETTAVVVTGQQAGLFGGPLYTLLKAQTAVAVAHTVAEQHGDVQCIPVFWVEDNDHDFAEIAQAAVPDREYTLVHTAVPEPPEETRLPVGVRRWKGTEAALEAVEAALHPTDFTADLMALLRRTCADGASLSQSFVQVLNTVLAPTGMLFLSAYVLQQRGLMAPVLRREIEAPGETERVVAAVSQQLTAHGYHVQAAPLAVNCMMVADGRRYRLDYDGEVFRAGEKVYTQRELLDLVDTTPHLLSPTVLTRPVVQDSLLPTVAYIAGPGEMAYAAQLAEVYGLAGQSMPAFVVRHSATLIEQKFERFLREREMAPEAMFRPVEQVEKDFAGTLADPALTAAFDRAGETVRTVFDDLAARVGTIDATLVPTAGKALAATVQQIEQLAARVVRAQKRQEETALVRLRQAHACLYPGHALQERAVNWIYFVNKFGTAALQAVLHELTAQPPVRHYLPVIAFREA